MGAEGAQRSTGTKGARRIFLYLLPPNTILKHNPDPNTHPNPQPSPSPTPSPSPNPSHSSTRTLGSQLVLGSKIESNYVAKRSHDLVQPTQHGWHGRTSLMPRLG